MHSSNFYICKFNFKSHCSTTPHHVYHPPPATTTLSFDYNLRNTTKWHKKGPNNGINRHSGLGTLIFFLHTNVFHRQYNYSDHHYSHHHHCSSRPPQQQQRGNSSKRGLLTAVTKDGAQDVCASQAPVKFFSLFFSSSNIYLQKMVLQFHHHQCHRSIQRWRRGLGLETRCLKPQVNFSFFYNNTTGLKTHTSWAPGTFFFSLFPSTNIYIQKRVTQLQPAPPVPPP